MGHLEKRTHKVALFMMSICQSKVKRKEERFPKGGTCFPVVWKIDPVLLLVLAVPLIVLVVLAEEGSTVVLRRISDIVPLATLFLGLTQ